VRRYPRPGTPLDVGTGASVPPDVLGSADGACGGTCRVMAVGGALWVGSVGGTAEVPPGPMTTAHGAGDAVPPGDTVRPGAAADVVGLSTGSVGVGHAEGGSGRRHGTVDAGGENDGRGLEEATGGSGGTAVAAGVQLPGVGTGGRTDVVGPPPGPAGLPLGSSAAAPATPPTTAATAPDASSGIVHRECSSRRTGEAAIASSIMCWASPGS
jgi:hypothetical protein